MKNDCAVARWLLLLKKNKSFRFLLFFSYFAYSEHFPKSPCGTFSLPMAHMYHKLVRKKKEEKKRAFQIIECSDSRCSDNRCSTVWRVGGANRNGSSTCSRPCSSSSAATRTNRQRTANSSSRSTANSAGRNRHGQEWPAGEATVVSRKTIVEVS